MPSPRKRLIIRPVPPDPVEQFIDLLDLAIEAQTRAQSPVSTAVIVALTEVRNAWAQANGHTIRKDEGPNPP